jgi:hypothetical protein
MTHKLIKTDDYLLVVDDSEIKEGDCLYGYVNNNTFKANKLSHLYINSKKIISHLPLNGSPILEGVDLLPPIEDDFEKFLDRDFEFGFTSKDTVDRIKWYYQTYFKEKYKYTEEDVIRIVEKSRETGLTAEYLMLSSQYPTEFECEMVGVIEHKDGLVTNQYEVPKTITTAQGNQWKGEYK